MKLQTAFVIEDISPRACGCDFCLKHKPVWFTDASGVLEINARIEPLRYRFGTETADFLMCPNCGVLIAAVSDNASSTIGVFNLNCLDAKRDWAGCAAAVDYSNEQTGDRLSRRAKHWMPVTLKVET